MSNFTSMDAARLIDISAVRSQHGLADIEYMVAVAKEYRFINVHTLPCWTKTVRAMLADAPYVYAGAPVGFPAGGHCTAVKLLEARTLIEDGVQEMDIVMNVGKFKSGEYAYVEDELSAIVALAPADVKTKVIIELNCLTDEELPRVCALVIASGADYLKTGTGWVAGDANLARIRRIKELTGDRIMVKAAGGVRTREEFDALRAMGVERFGINIQSALSIVRSFQ